jgi:hypothetical protein
MSSEDRGHYSTVQDIGSTAKWTIIGQTETVGLFGTKVWSESSQRADEPIDLITIPKGCLNSHQSDEDRSVSTVEKLPAEILKLILLNLTASSKINLALTNKHFATCMIETPEMLSFNLTYPTTAQKQSIIADEAFAGWKLDSNRPTRKHYPEIPRVIFVWHIHLTCTSCEPAAESLFDHTKKHLTIPFVPKSFDRLIVGALSLISEEHNSRIDESRKKIFLNLSPAQKNKFGKPGGQYHCRKELESIHDVPA